MWNRIAPIADIQRLMSLALLLGVYGFFASQFAAFASFNSLFAIMQGITIVGLVSLAATVTIIAGEIDLAAGSLAAFTAVVVFQLSNIVGPPVAIVLGLAVAVMFGAVQGYLIYRLKIQAIVLTIGSLVLLRGLSLVVANEKTLASTDFVISDLLQTRFFVFSPASILVLIVFVVLGLFLKFHKWGREIYAIGGSRREALAAGVPLARPLIITFTISAFCAGLAGVIISLRSGSAQPLALQDLLLTGVTAAFVGGVHILGGRGSALGAALGAFIVQLLASGMNFYRPPAYVPGLVMGLLLMLVIVLQFLTNHLERSIERARRASAT